MPYVKKSRATKSTVRKFKRTYKRKAYPKRTANFSRVSRQLMPVKFSTKLVYSEVFDIITAVNTPWSYLYSGNGLNDPNLTGGGHQPMGFDQLTPLYLNYCVTGAKIIIEGNHTASGGHMLSVGSGTRGFAFPTLPDAQCESRHMNTVIQSNQNRWKYSKYFSVADVLSIPKRTPLVSEVYWGSSSGVANPSYGTDIYLMIRNLDASEQINSQITVTIVYYVTYFNPAVTPQS